MNRRRVIELVAGSAVIAVLLVGLWHASAPIRLRKRFEAEAAAQLRGSLNRNGAQFRFVRVFQWRSDIEPNVIWAQYEVTYMKKDRLFTLPAGCGIYLHGTQWQGECYNPFEWPGVVAHSFPMQLESESVL